LTSCPAETGRWCVFGDRSLDELLDLLVVVAGGLGVDQIDLVLGDDDVVDADDVERHQVLFGLGLGTGSLALTTSTAPSISDAPRASSPSGVS